MKKITEIYVLKEYMKSGRDAYGNRTKTPAVGKFKRDPILASQGIRFIHYLIDLVVIYVIALALLIPIALWAPKTFTYLAQFSYTIKIGFTLTYDLVYLIITFLYFLIIESTTQRSIGKLVTNTVVIDEYGNKPAVKNILGRSLMRLVPFDAFSCLASRGWHDKVSRTYVVKRKEAHELKRLLLETDGVFLSDSEDLLD